MPFRRRRVFRKKRFNRRFIRFPKFFNTFKSSRRGMGNGKRFFKLRHIVEIISDGAGKMDIICSNGPTNFQDWTPITSLFDSYKICALKIKYTPALPNDTNVTTAFRPMYIVGEPDNGNQVVGTPNQAIEYENMKVMNMYRPWSYYYRIPNRTATIAGGGTIILQGGYMDINYTTGTASIQGTGTGFDANTSYGNIICTAYMVCKNRR